MTEMKTLSGFGFFSRAALLLCLTIVVAHLAFFVTSFSKQVSWGHLRELLYRWQSFDGAVLALAAAFIGARAIYDQVQQATISDDKRRARRAAALRASLALDIVTIHEYAEVCAKELDDLLTTARASSVHGLTRSPRLPDLPAAFTPVLADLLEAVADDQARPLKIFIRRLQIHGSRMVDVRKIYSLKKRLIATEILLEYIVHSAEIYARADMLLKYSHSSAPEPPEDISADYVLSRIKLLLSASLNESDLEDLVERRSKLRSGASVWPEN